MRPPKYQEKGRGAWQRGHPERCFWHGKTAHNAGKDGPTTLVAEISSSTKDICWTAGFLEGEGSFTGFGKDDGTGQVTAVQVNQESVSRLLSLYGGTVRLRSTPRGKPLWVWTVTGARARGVAMTMYSLMSEKRKRQIRELLANHGL